MHRRTVHRGFAALALATVLSIAGAHPAAAAANQGFLGRVAGLWSAVVGGESDSFLTRLTGWFDDAKSPRATTKRGWGIDPNGNAIYIDEPTDPPAPGTNG
jgi:hypothetical protein